MWPSLPFIDQGGRHLTKWDLFPREPSYSPPLVCIRCTAPFCSPPSSFRLCPKIFTTTERNLILPHTLESYVTSIGFFGFTIGYIPSLINFIASFLYSFLLFSWRYACIFVGIFHDWVLRVIDCVSILKSFKLMILLCAWKFWWFDPWFLLKMFVQCVLSSTSF